MNIKIEEHLYRVPGGEGNFEHWLSMAMSWTRLSYKTNLEDAFGMSIDSDIDLAIKLIRRGPEHAKFMRVLPVLFTIRAPRYWWAQMDTYKVGTTTLSGSTMHTLMKRRLTPDDFVPEVSTHIIDRINDYIDNGSFQRAKANLPEGFLQTRGWCANYQVLRTIFHQRRHHRLQEWQDFCDIIAMNMPYNTFITMDGKEK